MPTATTHLAATAAALLACVVAGCSAAGDTAPAENEQRLSTRIVEELTDYPASAPVPAVYTVGDLTLSVSRVVDGDGVARVLGTLEGHGPTGICNGTWCNDTATACVPKANYSCICIPVTETTVWCHHTPCSRGTGGVHLGPDTESAGPPNGPR